MTKNYKLSTTELQFFEENGYLGPFTLFEPEEMTALWKEIRIGLLETENAPFPTSKLNYDRHLDMSLLNEMICHPKIVDRMSSLLGDAVLSWRSEWFPKYPGDEGTDWHQAQSFVEFEGVEKLIPTKNEEPWELTAWIAISEATRQNGCMKVLPGTHKTWFFDEKRNIQFEPEKINKKLASNGTNAGFYGYDYEKLKLDKNWEPDESKAVYLELKPGQFFIFTSRCMHGSVPNITQSSTRFGWATRYIPTHVKVYDGQSSFQHFGETFSLDRYSTVLVAGKDTYCHNKVTLPMGQQAKGNTINRKSSSRLVEESIPA